MNGGHRTTCSIQWKNRGKWGVYVCVLKMAGAYCIHSKNHHIHQEPVLLTLTVICITLLLYNPKDYPDTAIEPHHVASFDTLTIAMLALSISVIVRIMEYNTIISHGLVIQKEHHPILPLNQKHQSHHSIIQQRHIVKECSPNQGWMKTKTGSWEKTCWCKNAIILVDIVEEIPIMSQ